MSLILHTGAKRFLWPLLVCLIVLTACNSAPQNRPLYQGSNGVMLDFPQQNNFQQFENDQFSVALRLGNDGAADIISPDPGYVSVSYDPSIFQLLETTGSLPDVGGKIASDFAPFVLKGRSQFVQVGEVDYLSFTFKSYPLPSNRPKAPSPIIFSACYPYKTTFIENVCVDRNLFLDKATPVCMAQTLTSTSQGAPIAVTSVEPRFVHITKDGQDTVKPRFKLTLQNLQSGILLWTSDGGAVACNLNAEGQDKKAKQYGTVYVEAHLNTQLLACGTEDPTTHKATNIAKFDHNQAEIICTLDEGIPIGANYESPLIIELHYFYISSITANIEVKRI